MRLLQPRDGPEGIVVHHQPDDAQIQLYRRGQHRGVLPKTAIADKAQITTRSSAASFAPIAAGADQNPSWQTPPGVRIEPGVRISNCCPTPFLFQPTSVVMIASSGNAFTGIGKNAFRHHRKRRRWSAIVSRLLSRNADPEFGDLFQPSAASRESPCGYICLATRVKTRKRRLGIGNHTDFRRIVAPDFRVARYRYE